MKPKNWVAVIITGIGNLVITKKLPDLGSFLVGLSLDKGISGS